MGNDGFRGIERCLLHPSDKGACQKRLVISVTSLGNEWFNAFTDPHYIILAFPAKTKESSNSLKAIEFVPS